MATTFISCRAPRWMFSNGRASTRPGVWGGLSGTRPRPPAWPVAHWVVPCRHDCSSVAPCRWPGNCSGWRNACSICPWTTSRSANSSASRSAASRRSSITWPMLPGRIEQAKPVLYRAAHGLASGDADARRVGFPGPPGLLRSQLDRGAQGYSGAWRDGLHLGSRPADVHEARLGAGRLLGDRGFHKTRVGEYALADGARLGPGHTFEE